MGDASLREKISSAELRDRMGNEHNCSVLKRNSGGGLVMWIVERKDKGDSKGKEMHVQVYRGGRPVQGQEGGKGRPGWKWRWFGHVDQYFYGSETKHKHPNNNYTIN